MNKMIVNPDTFQAIRSALTSQVQTCDKYYQLIKSVSSVELLRIQIDDNLNFNVHISKVCKSVGNQLNALIGLKQFLSFHAKEVLINSYIISNFNYCPLVWMFSSAQSVNKMTILTHLTKICYQKERSLQ